MDLSLGTGKATSGAVGIFRQDGPVRINMNINTSSVTEPLPVSASPTLLFSYSPAVGRSAEPYDPMVSILAWFAALPADSHEALFADFEDAAKSRNLRSLLDAISDWAATAELYANPEIADEVREAIGGREGVLDWLNG